MAALNCRTEPHSDNVENIDFPENDVGTAARCYDTWYRINDVFKDCKLPKICALISLNFFLKHYHLRT